MTKSRSDYIKCVLRHDGNVHIIDGVYKEFCCVGHCPTWCGGDKWLAWYTNFEHALYVNSQQPCKDCAKVMVKYILSAAKGNTQAETDDALKQNRL